MNGFQELRFWSPSLGCNAVRLSMVDDRGGEFFMIVPREAGKAWREKRLDVVQTIQEAIALGLEPGEVVADE